MPKLVEVNDRISSKKLEELLLVLKTCGVLYCPHQQRCSGIANSNEFTEDIAASAIHVDAHIIADSQERTPVLLRALKEICFLIN